MSRLAGVRYQPVDQRRARRQLRKRLLELRRKLCDGVVHTFVHERVVGIASHHADLTRVADIHLYALALDFASTLRHSQHLGRVGADHRSAHLDKGKLHATLDGGIVEVKDGYTLFWTLAPS